MAAPKGNKNAAKAKDWEAALRHELNNYSSSSIQRGLALRAIARNVVQKAVEESDWKAIDEIANRLDGKHAQSVEHTGEITNRHIAELSDDQLFALLHSAVSPGDPESPEGEEESPGVH